MSIVFRFLLFFSIVMACGALELQKAQMYENQPIEGWVMSEKLDGIRAYWDGKNLYTRQMRPIAAPEWFTKNLPPFALDGELWTKRGDFEAIQSIVMAQSPDERWQNVHYMVFEVPHAKGDFYQRLAQLQVYKNQTNLWPVRIIEQRQCENKKALERFLEEVIAQGGEGVMVKNPHAPYEGGRTQQLLKVKTFEDAEAKVVGYKQGKGKYEGMLGSLEVETPDGTRFFLGSGLDTKIRQNPPQLGTIITFKFYGYTKRGKPKFASFLRVRED
ncbi:MAG: DNA ligase [Thiovulaceae bacterium]|jgi:DNA ligase-1|nr:DNA ligase [Sulfurimonadaceae bacterium]